MLGIYSLIWTICHKLMWFYRNAVFFNIPHIFLMTHGENFGHLGHLGPLTVNKMALPSMYQRRWRPICAFIGKNTIALRVQRFAAGANIVYASHTPQTDELSLVLWSMGSQNLGPLGAARTMWVYFTLCQQSTLKSQNSGCVLYWRFWPNWWSEKIQAVNSPKSGLLLILEVHLILETRRYFT